MKWLVMGWKKENKTIFFIPVFLKAILESEQLFVNLYMIWMMTWVDFGKKNVIDEFKNTAAERSRKLYFLLRSLGLVRRLDHM